MDIETVSADSKPATENKTPAQTIEPAKEVSSKQEEHSETQDVSEQDQDSSDESQESEGQEGSEQQENGQPRKKNGYQKRLDRERRKTNEAVQKAAQLEAELQKLRSGGDSSKPQETTNASDQEPNPGDYDDNAAYIKAYTKWELKVAREEQAKLDKETKDKSAAQETQSKYNERLNEFKKVAPDFDDVVADFVDKYGGLNASPTVLQAIMKAEHGPKFLYDVLKTPGEYERLSAMSEIEVIMELGASKAKFAAQKEASQTTTPKTTKAPPPLKPIGSGTVATKRPQDMDTDEYLAWRKEQRKRG